MTADVRRQQSRGGLPGYRVAMTEQSPERPVEAPDTAATQPVDEAPVDEAPTDEPVLHDGPSLDPDGQVRTGNLTVDAVLASMEGLEDRPVSEHVAVFEHAHEQLRGALDSTDDR